MTIQTYEPGHAGMCVITNGAGSYVKTADHIAKVDRLTKALSMFYGKWENGFPCTEADEEGDCSEGSFLGNACKLDTAEEQEILNLIVEKAEDFEESCANCGKPYRAHLLHDKNKCHPTSDAAWFPGAIAKALESK